MDLSKVLIIFEKIMLGVALAAPVGPVSIEMMKRGLGHGFWSAFSIRAGGALGNTMCLIGTYLGLSQIMGHPQVMDALGMAGALLLLYMGFSTYQKSVVINLSTAASQHNGLLWGFYLSIINPVSLAFWPGVFAASIKNNEAINFSGFLLDLFVIVGVLLWGAGLSLVFACGKRILNNNVVNILTKSAAVLMIFYGLKYAYCVYARW